MSAVTVRLESVSHDILACTRPGLTNIPNLTPPQIAIGSAIQILCPKLSPSATGSTGDLQIRCTELVGNSLAGNQGDVPNPLLQMTTKEVSSQGTSSVETSTLQFTNLATRIAELAVVLAALVYWEWPCATWRRRLPVERSPASGPARTERPSEMPVPCTLSLDSRQASLEAALSLCSLKV